MERARRSSMSYDMMPALSFRKLFGSGLGVFSDMSRMIASGIGDSVHYFWKSLYLRRLYDGPESDSRATTKGNGR